MNVKRFIFGCLGVFSFIFLYEWILHGGFLNELYMQSASLWRTEDELQSHYFWQVMGQAVLAVGFCRLFLMKKIETGTLAEGARFGVWVGLILCSPYLILYAAQPLSRELIFSWCAGGIVELGFSGVIMAAVYRSY